MGWNKPNFLKTKREKHQEQVVSIAVNLIKLGVALEDYKSAKEKEALEKENIRLQNELLKIEIEKNKTIPESKPKDDESQC